jgi:hypothetical protein
MKIPFRMSIVSSILMITISCTYPRFLPSGLRGEIRHGKYLDQIWSDGKFKGSAVYSIEHSWGSSKPSEELVRYAQDKISAIAITPAPYRMTLEFNRIGGMPPLAPLSDGPRLVVEGKIEDSSGHLVAAFRSARPTIFSTDSNFKSAIDDTLRWVLIDLGPGQ